MTSRYPFTTPHVVITAGSHAGRTVPLEDSPVTVGRDPRCTFVLDSPDVSRNHSEIVPGTDGLVVRDLGSANGTYLNGRPVKESRLGPDDRVGVDTTELVVVDPAVSRVELPDSPLRYVDTAVVGRLLPLSRPADGARTLEDQTTTIGSESFNDLVIPDETVSTNHCKVKNVEGTYTVVDLRSTNGTWINGTAVEGERPLWHGDELGVGRVRFRFELVRRPYKPPVDENEGRTILYLLASLGLLVVILGAFAFALLLRHLFADAPAFGPLPELHLRTLWTSDDTGGLAPVLADLEGDGTVEVITAGPGARIRCLDGASGSTLFVLETVAPVRALGLVPGEDGRASLALAVTETGCQALGPEGRIVWETPYGEDPGIFVAAPAVAVRTGTLPPLVALGSTSGRVTVVDALTGAPWYLLGPVGGVIDSSPALIPLPGGDAAVAAVTSVGVLHGGTARDGRVWTLDRPVQPGTSPLAADTDGDGTLEFVLAAAGGRSLLVVDPATGTLRSELPLLEPASGAPLAAPLAPRPGADLIVPLASGAWTRVRPTSSQPLFTTRPLSTAGPSLPALFDVDRDGVVDAVVAPPGGDLTVVDGRSGRTLAHQPPPAPLAGTVVLGDVDRDARLDLVVRLLDGRVWALSTNRPMTRGAVPWGAPGLVGTRRSGLR